MILEMRLGRSRMRGWPAAAAGLALMLAGCEVGPDYHQPATSVPSHFSSPSLPAATAAASPADPGHWWRSLHDPELDSLIPRAIQANFDVALALTHLQEARTEEAVVLGMALPEVDASGGIARGTGHDMTRGRLDSPLSAAEDPQGLAHLKQAVGFDAGWELDLFGQFRREFEAVRDDAQAAAELRNEVLVSVIADVARAYFDLRGLQMRLAVADQDIATAQKTVTFVQARYDHGLTNELDLTLAKRELATLEASAAPLAARMRAAEYTLSILLGQYPGAMAAELEQPGKIPVLPQGIGPGLPVELLRRRPDIRESERRLAAATARIGVATANLFPHVSLTGAVGFQGPANPVLGHDMIWAAGTQASWSLLDFGTLDALVDIADLEARGQLIAYKKTVLEAVAEVDSNLASYAAAIEQLHHLDEALVAASRAVTLASQRYDRGLTDFLNVLDAQRAEYGLEDQEAAAQAAAADTLASLYKSLGGGWQPYQQVPPIRRPQPAIVAMIRHVVTSDVSGP